MCFRAGLFSYSSGIFFARPINCDDRSSVYEEGKESGSKQSHKGMAFADMGVG
jgi:hypothetical protein